MVMRDRNRRARVLLEVAEGSCFSKTWLIAKAFATQLEESVRFNRVGRSRGLESWIGKLISKGSESMEVCQGFRDSGWWIYNVCNWTDFEVVGIFWTRSGDRNLIRFLLSREFALSFGNFLLFCNILSFRDCDRRRFVVAFTNCCTASISRHS